MTLHSGVVATILEFGEPMETENEKFIAGSRRSHPIERLKLPAHSGRLWKPVVAASIRTTGLYATHGPDSAASDETTPQ